jgi:MoaA/NifB/PqqE/SkfB family radical SAM enzyme
MVHTLTFFPTNRCYRNCLHCYQNRSGPAGDLPLELAEAILSEARSLGFSYVCLTGGEVALYPHLKELLRLIASHGFQFSLMTSGFLFPQRVLPLLLDRDIRDKIDSVGFSLEGARAETHEALRGPGSFQEVLTAAALCQTRNLPFAFKSMITPFNREEITQMALLAASLGGQDQFFLPTIPTPRLIKSQAILEPQELSRIIKWISSGLAPAMRIKVHACGYSSDQLAICDNIFTNAVVDFQGNLLLCCDLALVASGDGSPTRLGGEFLANLREVSLKEALVRHFQAATNLVEKMINSLDKWRDHPFILCYWCYKHFGKLEWLKNYPDSPWAAGILGPGAKN